MEKWRDVPEFPDFEVSDQGQVRRKSDGRVLTQHGRNGYLRVTFPRRARGCRHRPKRVVHRLVMAAFVGPCPAGMAVLHHNDIPTDNRLANLRYGTRRENEHDKVRNGRYGPGKPIPVTVVAEAHRLHRDGKTWAQISGLLGWSASSLRRRVYAMRENRPHGRVED